MGVGAYAGRHLPPHDPRLLQGLPVPRLGQRDPRHAPRAGHAEDGRPEAWMPLTYCDLPDRDPRASPASRSSPASSRRTRSSGRRSRAGTATSCSGSSRRCVAGLTAFYMFRLVFMTFYGECRADEQHTARTCTSRPPSMTVPLSILAARLDRGRPDLGIPHVLAGAGAHPALLRTTGWRPVFGGHGADRGARAAPARPPTSSCSWSSRWRGGRPASWLARRSCTDRRSIAPETLQRARRAARRIARC